MKISRVRVRDEMKAFRTAPPGGCIYTGYLSIGRGIKGDWYKGLASQDSNLTRRLDFLPAPLVSWFGHNSTSYWGGALCSPTSFSQLLSSWSDSVSWPSSPISAPE